MFSQGMPCAAPPGLAAGLGARVLDTLERFSAWVARMAGSRSSGRHRAGAVPAAPPRVVVGPAAAADPLRAGAGLADTQPIPSAEVEPDPRGAVIWDDPAPLVRPFVVAHERALARAQERDREERLVQRPRRRATWTAVHGVDIGPRRVHGIEVAR
ncbi:hypothetical protein RKE29_00120 [Streptomyces sp. B1866]|uniref:hypothetical protein n=1 Tax=Streptomyces sp. B1866 TaxID=3075431 RepID=UPI00288ED1B3|nr:hypothetical protein [Streptomyces sp. B1866]MDT3395079.1 hypothetical protein [Streptomyces sp. B1866]